MVDTEGFYLAATGGQDPALELAATLAAFRAPVGVKPDDHALCRFPRRRHLIEAALPEHAATFASVPCAAYRDWRLAFPIHGASLVFSSSYLNNPSSMYGHTLLRLYRGDGASYQGSELLDYAVNFAANPTTTNPLLYAYFGLTGRFFGGFSLMPYYLKVQEYSNAESRDLWEYPLLLSEAELEALMATLWEVGPHGIRYWYVDENCSFVLLAVLAAARPEIAAISEFPGIVTPKDTVTALARRGALGPAKRRLSAHSRLMLRRRELRSDEAKWLDTQIEQDALLPDLMSIDATRRMRVLDALLEWIAYDEKLFGARTPKRHARLWDEALKARAAIAQPSPLLEEDAASFSPERGHSSGRLSLGLESRGEDPLLALIGFRFALHDLASPPEGYGRDQEITMGDFLLQLRRDASGRARLAPETLTLLRILSIPELDRMTGAFAWTLLIGSDQRRDAAGAPWLSHRLEGGAGVAFDVLGGRFYAIPVLALGRLRATAANAELGFGLRLGWIASLGPQSQLGLLGDSDGVFVDAARPSRGLRAFASFSVSPLHEVRLEVRRGGRDNAAEGADVRAIWFRYL